MLPDTQRPPVVTGDHGHGDLINAVYRAIHRHPNPQQMASYGKILAALLADQAKLHAGGTAVTQHTAGPVAPPANYGVGQGLMPSDETPVTDWAAAARGNPPPLASVGPIDDPIMNALGNYHPGIHGIAGRLPTVGY